MLSLQHGFGHTPDLLTLNDDPAHMQLEFSSPFAAAWCCALCSGLANPRHCEPVLLVTCRQLQQGLRQTQHTLPAGRAVPEALAASSWQAWAMCKGRALAPPALALLPLLRYPSKLPMPCCYKLQVGVSQSQVWCCKFFSELPRQQSLNRISCTHQVFTNSALLQHYCNLQRTVHNMCAGEAVQARGGSGQLQGDPSRGEQGHQEAQAGWRA